jgi:hypothetical protein
MKNRIIKYCPLVIFVTALFITSCEKEYTWKIKPSNKQALIVDGIITNEYKPQCIKLSLLNNDINAHFTAFSGATVSVSDSTLIHNFSESATEPGSYYSEAFQGVIGKTYTLTIHYLSYTFTASAHMVPITALDSIKLIKKDSLYRYNHTEYGDPAMVEVYLDWSSSPKYCTTYGSCNALETFYILNNVDIVSVIPPDKEIIYFPKETRIIRRKYSLSTEHQAFLRSLLMETEWRGGVFDVQQGNVLTNLNNGALGYFGACMVLSDTTIVK